MRKTFKYRLYPTATQVELLRTARQIAVFDRYVVPPMFRIEALVPPPFGQSLFAVLRCP